MHFFFWHKKAIENISAWNVLESKQIWVDLKDIICTRIDWIKLDIRADAGSVLKTSYRPIAVDWWCICAKHIDLFSIKFKVLIESISNIFSLQNKNMIIIWDGFLIETLLQILHLIKAFRNKINAHVYDSLITSIYSWFLNIHFLSTSLLFLLIVIHSECRKIPFLCIFYIFAFSFYVNFKLAPFQVFILALSLLFWIQRALLCLAALHIHREAKWVLEDSLTFITEVWFVVILLLMPL